MPVRHADPERDAAACAAIYAPYVLEGTISFEEVPPSADRMRERITAVTATHPWLVEERDGVVIGYAYASAHSPRSAYRWTVDVAVYVDAGHHRRGVGRGLSLALLEALRAQNFRVACAGITLPNPASVRLHESLGFTPVGIYRRVGWKMGAWRDVGWWQLDLHPGRQGAPAEPAPPVR